MQGGGAGAAAGPAGGDVSSLLERQQERFQADPSDRRAFEALEEALFVAGDWPALVALYEQRLGAADLEKTPRELARVHLRLAQVLDERMGAGERAIEHLRLAVRADPRCRPAL